MPELPEVETIAQTLRPKILRKKIKKMNIFFARTLRFFSENIVSSIISEHDLQKRKLFFRKNLINSFFSEISRIGKFLILKISPGDFFLVIHLKMTGQLFFVDKENFFGGGDGEKIDFKNIRVEIFFEDNSRFFFADSRKFGFWKLVNKRQLENVFKNIGIDPFSKNFTFNNFKKILRPKKNIKSFLLDQKFIAGIGNIYADEILFATKINPQKKIEDLNQKNIRNIFDQIKKILNLAIKNRGTTFNSFRDGNNHIGSFQKFLKVYGRNKKKCLNCNAILKKVRVSGRGTTFCPNCQR